MHLKATFLKTLIGFLFDEIKKKYEYKILPSSSLNRNSKSQVESAPETVVLNSTAEKSKVICSSLRDCFHQGRRSTTGRKSGMGNLQGIKYFNQIKKYRILQDDQVSN